ncbi:MAG TPA: GxxExxY protein [Anaerolineae bacterium]|nr:GxxExxY protein [Anaerolineae bacterium]
MNTVKPFLHKDLSYAVRGVLFDVYNCLGPNLPESFYREAAAVGLEAAHIKCQTEKQFSVHYHGVEVGRYFVDIWVEGGKIILELKVVPRLLPVHKAQALSYLKVTNADLAFLVNFGQESLVDERLPNFLRDKKAVFAWQPQEPDPQLLYPELVNELLAILHRVHFELGPGFFHYVYRRAAMVELQEQSIGYEYIKETPVYYKNTHLGTEPTRLIFAENKILVAAVAVQTLTDAMKAQLKAKMKHHNVSLGLLANFNKTQLEFMMIR